MKNLMSLPSLAPGHETQCYRQRKELISLSVFLQFGADRDQICLGRPHLIQVPSHVAIALTISVSMAIEPTTRIAPAMSASIIVVPASEFRIFLRCSISSISHLSAANIQK